MTVTIPEAITVTSRVSDLQPYHPGKPIDDVKRELGLTDVIKLASNENPLGPGPLAIEAMQRAAVGMHIYPDAACTRLREAVAHSVGMPEDGIVFGNGSDDIIHLLGITYLEPGDMVISGAPTFSRYEAAAVLNRAEFVAVPLKNHTFDIDAILSRCTGRTRMVFIANPNNPTGTIISADALRSLVNGLPDRCLLVLDEAYKEYVTAPGYPDSHQFVAEGRPVVSLRTFSKIHGLAALRLGYGIMPRPIAAHLEQVREPFNVNGIAQAAGQAALLDLDHIKRSLECNEAGKLQLVSGLNAIGLQPVPTQGNFIWVDTGKCVDALFAIMLRAGVIVRTGTPFGAPAFLRVTVGTREQNERFLLAFALAVSEVTTSKSIQGVSG